MKADARAIRALVGNDLRALLRSPRTLVVSVGLPLLVWPLMFLVMQWVQASQEERVDSTTFLYARADDRTDTLLDGLLEQVPSDEVRIEEVQVSDPRAALEAEEIHFYIEEAPAPEPSDDETPDTSRVPGFSFVFRGDRDLSREGSQKLSEALASLQTERRAARLLGRGFPIPPAEAGVIESEDLATAAESSGLLLGRFLSLILMLFLLIGGSVVASDSLAGEKERGTLETLLTTAIRRSDLVIAKQLVILIVAMTITAIQLTNMLVYLGFGLLQLPEGFTIPVTPQMALLLLLLFVPIAFLVSNVLLLTSAYAKTYKEAQLYYFPVFILSLLPAAAPILPTMELQSAIVLVPVANLSLAVKDLLSGTIDWPWVFAAWVITAAAGVGVARLSTQALRSEALITASEGEAADLIGGAALLPRHILRWIAAVWAIILVGANFLGSDAPLTTQLSFNFGLMLLTTVIIIKRYKLAVRDVLALRWPDPRVWLAVILGAPCGLIVGAGLVNLTGRFLPVPDRILEAFEATLLPEGMPIWKLALLLAVAPAVVEEIFFRGLLLHGLHNRPIVRRILMSAIIFGIFHVTFFRILPTAYLGVLLAATTLASGSIFPAMLWHAINNSLGVWADIGGAAGDPLWLSLAAAGLALSCWVLWRVRDRGAVEAHELRGSDRD